MTGKQPKRKPRPGIDELGRTPLHHAAANGDADRCLELLAAGADPSQPDDNGWTPLHFAAQAVCGPAAKALLDAGSKLDAKDSFGNTALWRAVFSSRGDGAVIRLLRSAGADPHCTNNHGISPIKLAQTIANYDVAQFFADLLLAPEEPGKK